MLFFLFGQKIFLAVYFFLHPARHIRYLVRYQQSQGLEIKKRETHGLHPV